MNAKDTINMLLQYKKKSKKDVASLINWTPSKLSLRIGRGTIRVDDFFEILEKLDIEIKYIDKSTGAEVHLPKGGRGRRVNRMVNLVTYDTANSDAISSNFYADGENEYTDGMAMELYVDHEGRYFFAQYSSLGGVRDSIIPVEKEDAMAFVKKYGRYDVT